MGKKKNLAELDPEDMNYIIGKMERFPNFESAYANRASSKLLNYKIDLKCKNKRQKEVVQSIKNNKITVVEGVFGVGKSYVINSMALKMLKDGEVERIILILPTVEVGDMHLGLLPGTLDEKLTGHSMNELDCFSKILKNNGNLGSKLIVDDMLRNKLIEIRPISFLRGASLENAFICVSEAEEFTKEELFLIISRYESGKMVISGDPLQSSRKIVKNGNSGLLHATDRLINIDGVGVIKFEDEDIVRNDILIDIYHKWKE